MLQRDPTQPNLEHGEPQVSYSEVYQYFERHGLHLGDVTSTQEGRDYYGPVLIDFILDKTIARNVDDDIDHSTDISRETLTRQFARFEEARRQARAQGQMPIFNASRNRFEEVAQERMQDTPAIAVALATAQGLRDSEAGDIARDIVITLGMYYNEQSEQARSLVSESAGGIVVHGEVLNEEVPNGEAEK